ncbi:MAG: lipopolysaccharide transport periplasmic protein LptA [Alphaproteobacteria bacterium]|nr:lipopolysaccharide transport periplasmic protein LptA [Alphaproteobacteria bacterium]
MNRLFEKIYCSGKSACQRRARNSRTLMYAQVSARDVSARFPHRSDFLRILQCTFLFGLVTVSAAHAVEAPKKFDNNQPIEITSDSLEVLQEQNRATFVGHVVAIQGDMRLKSDKMIVHYHKAAEGEAKAASGGQGSIEKIEVEGNVFLTSPEETAKGDTGLYEVTGRTLTLDNHVVLTRGQNVLKGDHLVYNLDTGKSVITSANGQTQSTDGKKQRVRALFVPEKDKK